MSQGTEKPAPKLIPFPVYVLLPDDTSIPSSVECKFVRETELPTKGNYFVVTKTGCHMHKDNVIISATMPTENGGIKYLGELNAKARLRLPRIPALIIARCHQFFQNVWNELRSESEVMLVYHKTNKVYDIWCPEQKVSGASVKYASPMIELDKFRKGDREWTWIGTIHSHCDFSAYHSGVDTADEDKVDGIHITLGHVDGDDFSMVSSVCINGKRWQLPPPNIVSGVIQDEERQKRSGYVYMSKDEFYRCVLNDQDTEQFYNIYEPEVRRWVKEKVQKETWGNSTGGCGKWSI